MRGFRRELQIWNAVKKYAAKIAYAYRCEGDENSDDISREGTNVFIVERLDDSLYNYFEELSPKLDDPNIREQARIEIDKIFTLVKNMNDDFIFHRDAHGSNIMYMKNLDGTLTWKFIDLETVYLLNEVDYKGKKGVGIEKISNGAIGRDIPIWGINEDIQKHTRGWIRGVNVDIASIGVSLVNINKEYYKLFPNWVKQIIQDAKKMISDGKDYDMFPDEPVDY